ncbi:MAG: DNA photolyase family protein [Pseudomonadota bacterium]|nr:DNA photolyase family protein [Pseudomonadota bacterium]
MTALLWFRQDLRLADHPALLAATAQGPTACLYVLDDDTRGPWAIGGAQRWWLHHSLASLAASLDAIGGRLIIRRGPAAATVAAVADEIGATSIHATRHYEPWWRAADAALGERLTLHDGDTLVPPEQVVTGSGTPFKVYGPFYRALATHLPPPEPLSAPERIEQPAIAAGSDRLEDWHLRPTRPDWATGFGDWHPGEGDARRLLADFHDHAGDYARRRDLPSEAGTSSLSPHLHFGEISPRTVWHSLAGADAGKFLKELAWRDFARSALLGQPHIASKATRPEPRWRTGPQADADFAAWTRGRMGYPIVDAGMRQLWATGWMHNRVRMIAASFLVKHLLVDWRRGAAWFWDTLVDADLGSNSLNWQWIAGTGSDSSPFARIMAPLVQSPKFAAAGYIRRFVPELADLADPDIHDPLDRGSYPAPLVGHREARERALAAIRG